MNKYISLVALAVVSAPAVAADTSSFYGSAGGGAYRLESGAFDDVAPAMTLLGGYQFTKNVAFEASYTRLFETSDQFEGLRVEADGNVWDLSTRLSYPMGNRFSPFVRLGYSYVDLSAVAVDNGVRARANDYDNAFTWGVGSSYEVNRRINLSGEVSRTNIDEGDLDTLSVRLNYGFGSR